MHRKHIVIVALLLLLGALNATVLLEDNFSGTVGTFLTDIDNGWTAHSGAGTTPMSIASPGLTYPGYLSSGIGNATSASGNGEDVNKGFSAASSGSVYYSFLVNTAITTTTAGYSTHFQSGTSSFFGRFWIRLVGSDVNFGLAKTTAAATWDPTNYAINTTYLIVLKYTFNTGSTTDDAVYMWVNPVLGNTEPTPTISITNDTATDATSISMVGLRQWNAATLARFDGIRVGTSWADVAGTTATNTPPVITNIVQTPASDITTATTVSVSATITDDGGVYYSALKWGTVTGVYPNTITMNNTGGNTYTTATSIPAQANGTTVYYVIVAEDEEPLETISPQQSYTVENPTTATLPYSQTFSGTWGDTYTYSVAGTRPWYLYATTDNAAANGFGGTLEEHWLVLPAINFNNYINERMTFNMIATYGTIDANNYLKLLYSNNYTGLGDPYAATWTEIPFTQPTIGGGETSSGVLNLSGIIGTNVRLAFKYYSTDAPTRWEIDDISIYIASPMITVVPSTLNGFNYGAGSGPSAAQSFTVTGNDLTGSISIAGSTNYEISLSAVSGYTTPIVLNPTGGNVAPTTIWVRLKANLPIGTYNGETITLSSAGAANKTVTLNGAVTNPTPPVATAATNVAATSFTANWDSVPGATAYYLDVYTSGSAVATGLFISEYIEGSSNNKALEIFNGTGAPVDLSDYRFENWYNGLLTPSMVQLSGILDNGDVYVLAHTSANASIQALADTLSGSVSFNGNDALVIRKISTDTIVDIFGRVGENPGTAWGIAPLTTINQTLRRKITVLGGVLTNPDSGFPTLETEWDTYAVDNIDDLGQHTINASTYVPGYENLFVGNTTSYPVSGLTSGVTYHYVVRTYNTYGTSANSNQISVTTGGPLATPVVTITQSGNTITLNWNAIPGAVGYRVEAATDPFGSYTLLGTTNLLTYDDPSAQMKFYRVIAY